MLKYEEFYLDITDISGDRKLFGEPRTFYLNLVLNREEYLSLMILITINTLKYVGMKE